jgi:hypothetical protein
MNARLARALVRLYPRAWQERYGEEFEAMLIDGDRHRSGIHGAADVVWSAVCEHIRPTTVLHARSTSGGVMDQVSYSFGRVSRQPIAALSLSIALTALVVVLGAVALNGGRVHETDEGVAAHLWQILMAAQVPAVLVFAIKWLPRAPRPSLQFLALQAGAILANLAAVFFLT